MQVACKTNFGETVYWAVFLTVFSQMDGKVLVSIAGLEPAEIQILPVMFSVLF